MASILLKDVPAELHQRLKDQAVRSRRSMSQEVLHILERDVSVRMPLRLPEPVKPKRPISGAQVVRAIREARR